MVYLGYRGEFMGENVILYYEKYKGEMHPLIIKNEYIDKVYNIIPDRFIDGGRAVEEILNTLTALRTSKLRIEKADDGSILYIDSNEPIHFEILYSGKNVGFYYVIPDKYEDALVSTIRRIYKRATIKEKKDYFNSFIDSYVCQFKQKKHFVYSIDTDYRENAVIEGLLNISKNIKDDDKVLLQFSIKAEDEKWKDNWRDSYQKIREGKELVVYDNLGGFLIEGLFKIGDSVLNSFDIILGSNEPPRRDTIKDRGFDYIRYDERDNRNFKNRQFGFNSISRGTIQKVSYDGYEMQIRMYCDSDKNTNYYANLFGGVFKMVDGDQQIVKGRMKRFKEDRRKMEYTINKQIYSTKEVGTFLQLPNRRLQLEFKDNCKTIENVEINIPKELRQNGIPLGVTSYKGEKIPVSWVTHDKHMAPMHKIITGLQRTGKSSYITNFAIEAIKQGHSVFVIDTIKTCDVANNIRDYLPDKYKDKIIVLDFSNLDYLLPLAWNEINPSEGSNKEKLKKASMVSGNFAKFLETAGDLKGESQRLSPKMLRYLSSACKVVTSIKNTTILDVIDCLVYVDKRHEFIKKSGISESNRAIQDLYSLDEYDKEGNLIGTKMKEISGIIDRASILFNDYMLELLLSTPNDGQIDFRKWADEGKCVLIKMSDLDFNRESLKTLVTLVYSKIWLSMLARGGGDNHRLTHVILDEVHNFPQVTDMLKTNCRESAKYGLSYVFTSHLLIDLKGLLPYIKSSGANFMLFKTTKENFKLLEEELMLGGYTLDDCMMIKDYHTVNVVNYDRDYVVFTSKVIDPVDKRFIKKDRLYIDEECSRRYGVRND